MARVDPRAVAAAGVSLCRRGDWDRGIIYLEQVISHHSQANLPGLAYSYLGYGLARFRKKPEDGLVLCRHAARIQFYEPDNMINLARTHLLLGDRRAAVRAVARGLSYQPDHAGLLELQEDLGQRRSPILSFLPRDNALNRFLGRLRASWTNGTPADDAAP